jgi:signal transduction histidine kinase
MRRLIQIVTFCICTVFSYNSVAQVNRASLVGAYIYNFGRYTTWPNESTYNNFLIVLVGDDQEITKEVISFSKAQQLKGKPIMVEKYKSVPTVLRKETRLLVLFNDQSAYLPKVLNLIENKNILLVSDRYADKRSVMYNLLDKAGNAVSFEINRANIINQGLQVDPEIILLGGTEIDVAQLYRSSQKTLDTLQNKLNLMKDSLQGLNHQISTTLQLIQQQIDSINAQKELLKLHNTEIESDKKEINAQKSEILNKKELIDKQQLLLDQQKVSMVEHKSELEEQKLYINNQLKEINKSKLLLDSLKTEIDKQHNELGQRDAIIQHQRITVILAFATGILSLIILISLFRGYRNKVKKNKILTEQKEQIEKINNKLEITNKSLYGTITRLNETQSQLVASEKMASLGVLTAGIAHEINNPVNFIYTGINSLSKDINELTLIFNEILQKVNASGDEKIIASINEIDNYEELNEILEIIPQTIDDIKVGAERASDIIKGLRNFSRIDKDSMQFVDIHEGIDSSLLLLRNKFKNHISVVKEYSQLPTIECYPGKLNQAFMNIISNAIDAIEVEGKITIRTSVEDDYVNIQIEDSGKGIAPEVIDKIFDPFFTTKSVGQGVGLGLSITFGIIKEHNGKIDVKSEINRGTIFTISLPCTTNKEKEV